MTFAAENGSVATRPNASRVRPRPTGTCARVPPVDLADLARLVRRPLEGAGGEEGRSDPREVLLQDGDPAPVSVCPEALAG